MTKAICSKFKKKIVNKIENKAVFESDNQIDICFTKLPALIVEIKNRVKTNQYS